uniref:Uncharacterized protein n=1 Tax=Glossina austeni TaxID=7395 RepID=A0A1A9UZK2_GLOAU
MSLNCRNEDDNNIEESMDNDYEEHHQPDDNEKDIYENGYGPNVTANNFLRCDNKDGGESGSDNCIIIKSGTDDADIITNEDDSNVSSTTGSVTNTKLSHSNRSDYVDKAWLKCYNSMDDVVLKFNNMSMQEQLEAEENAKCLFEKTRSEKDRNIAWCDLNLQQKIPLFWTSFCEENLSDDPVDNFKQFYVMNAPRSSNTSMNELKEKSLIIWETMNTKQRLPFKVQAFISKVVKGEANIEDADDLQRRSNKCWECLHAGYMKMVEWKHTLTIQSNPELIVSSKP